MPEKYFDREPSRAKKRTAFQKQDKQPRDLKMSEVRHNEEMFAKSLSYNVQQTSGNIICSSVLRLDQPNCYAYLDLKGNHLSNVHET